MKLKNFKIFPDSVVLVESTILTLKLSVSIFFYGYHKENGYFKWLSHKFIYM